MPARAVYIDIDTYEVALPRSPQRKFIQSRIIRHRKLRLYSSKIFLISK